MSNVRRRTIVAGMAIFPVAAFAQGRKIVVGVLSWWPPAMEKAHMARLREGLAALGYVEGRNLELVVNFVSGDVARAKEVAKDYVERKVDVIVAAATPAATIAKEATTVSKTPIVMAPVSDPLATGLVQSIARPGGNLTGMAMIGPDLTDKKLELLREIKPDTKTIAFIGWTRDQNSKTFLTRIGDASARMGLRLVVRMVDAASEIDAAMMTSLKAEGVDVVVYQPIFQGYHERLVAVATAAGLPSMSDFPVFAEAGGLMTFGMDDRPQMNRAAYYIDRIVRGTSPADLPIEMPTGPNFVINAKTAKQFGLTISNSLLLRATEVIE